MQEHRIRLFTWLAANLLFVPLLILLLQGYHRVLPMVETVSGHTMPSWLNNLCLFLLFGGSYVGLGYAVAHRLNQRFPDSPKQAIRTPY